MLHARLITLIALLLVARAAWAQEKPRLIPLPDTKSEAAALELKADRIAVAGCVDSVRASRLDSLTTFDAYVDSNGQFRWFGTKAQTFQFQKCLSARGIDFPAK